MRIHHIALSVWSLDASIQFYKSLFGFTEVRRFEKQELMGRAAFLRLGDVSLEIWEFKDQREPKDDLSDLNIFGIKHIALEVDSVDGEYRRISSYGIKISEPKDGETGKYCFLKDPDGIVLELYQPHKE